jgi:hypothetical protein
MFGDQVWVVVGRSGQVVSLVASPPASFSGDHSQAWKAGSGSAFPGDLSGEATLCDRLRLLRPVMSEAGAPLYPSDSKPVLRYSRKMKDAKLIGLIVESLEATSVSRPTKGFLRQGSLGSSPVLQGYLISLKNGRIIAKG